MKFARFWQDLMLWMDTHSAWMPWIVAVLAIAGSGIGSWLWLEWYGRSMARWNAETRRLELQMRAAEAKHWRPAEAQEEAEAGEGWPMRWQDLPRRTQREG